MPQKRRWVIFEGARGPDDGQVRVGVWDRVCVPGEDEKDGQSTEFTLETLSQMVDNFLDRDGDPIPLDANHLSNYTHVTGQPAPALAFYGALAIVWGGKIVRLEHGRDTPPCPGSSYVSPSTATEMGIDVTRDGLWCFRNEVTAIGMELLKGFKLVSPTFLSDGTRRDGTPVGYCLAAVAATNTPWQSATEITFDKVSPAGTAPAQQEEAKMALSKYAKFAGAAEGADDKTVMDGLGEKLGKLAQEAMEEDAFEYEEEASRPEEMAEALKCEGDDGAKAMSRKMSAMAKSFRRFAKLSKFEAGSDDDKDDKKKFEEEQAKMAKLEADKKDADDAKFAAMSATIDGLKTRLAKFERSEEERAEVARQEAEARFERLADQAIDGGYPKAKREALIKFARSDFEAARSTVEHLLPKGRPAHLMDRFSSQGAPTGQAGAARTMEQPKTRVVKSPLGNFKEVDSGYADKIREFAESKDPAISAKLDKLMTEKERPIMFNRLLAAGKVVRAEFPDLAEAAEAAE